MGIKYENRTHGLRLFPLKFLHKSESEGGRLLGKTSWRITILCDSEIEGDEGS